MENAEVARGRIVEGRATFRGTPDSEETSLDFVQHGDRRRQRERAAPSCPLSARRCSQTFFNRCSSWRRPAPTWRRQMTVLTGTLVASGHRVLRRIVETVLPPEASVEMASDETRERRWIGMAVGVPFPCVSNREPRRFWWARDDACGV